MKSVVRVTRKDSDATSKANNNSKHERKPHKCPICDGKGHLPCGYYGISRKDKTSDELVETCKTCKGRGIVWG